jgi:RNA polymerase sigma factor (sigma-70 family)
MDFLPPITIEQQRKLIDKGTSAALNKLVLHTLSEAVAYAKQCARSLNLEEPEIVSLCWIALRSAAARYCHRKSRGIRFFAFAKQWIRGQIALELKQKQVVRNGEQAVLSETEDTKPLVDTHVDPDFSSMECKELFDKVKPVLFDKLNEIEIAILILRYQSGFSFTEIGERIGCSRQSIQKKHVAAILKIRKELKRKGEVTWTY